MSTIVDDVHALFERWASGVVSAPPIDPFAREVLKLAVHEWIANLVQHADFAGRCPAVRLRAVSEGRRVRCVIEDNSEGFDLEACEARSRVLQQTSPVPTERGRGLLMIIACTEDLSYRPCPPLGGDGHGSVPWQRLEFWISPHGEGLTPLPLGPFFDGEMLSESESPHPPPADAFGQEGPAEDLASSGSRLPRPDLPPAL